MGKQHIATKIVSYLLQDTDENTHFYDLCCGSGAISLELINQGIKPENITVIDLGGFGYVWESLANSTFDMAIFEEVINKISSVENIQQYLKDLANQPINQELLPYHYLILQCGAFGSKQIGIRGDKWINATFRSYWQPTANSNRRSPVNPMMPMPQRLLSRMQTISEQLKGRIEAYHMDVREFIPTLIPHKNSKIHLDPPYENSTGYTVPLELRQIKQVFDLNIDIYISEGKELENVTIAYLILSQIVERKAISQEN